MNRRRPTPFDIGPVHFVGIGGIGMSGIAEIMLRVGYTVQGFRELLGSIGSRDLIVHKALHRES